MGAAALVSCTPPAVPAELLLSLSPRTVSGARPIVATAEAHDGTGDAGVGVVTFSASGGSLLVPVEAALEGGVATTTFTCDAASDSTCVGRVRVVAEWRSGAQTLKATAELSFAAGAVPVDAGTWGGGDVFPLAEPLVFGTLREGTPGFGAVARLGAPDRPSIGFPAAAVVAALTTEGRVLYVDPTAGLGAGGDDVVRRFVRDVLTYDAVGGRWTYPASPAVNDEVLPTPGCAVPRRLDALVVQEGTDALFYHCESGDWFGPGGALVLPAGANLLAVTSAGALLFEEGTLSTREPGGTTHPVAGLVAQARWVARVAGTGFRVAVGSPGGALARYSIDEGGSATKDGDYADFPTTTQAGALGAMDAAGNLFQLGVNVANGAFDVVARRPLAPAATTIEYTEANAGTDSWTSTTPRLYTRLSDSLLLTGP